MSYYDDDPRLFDPGEPDDVPSRPPDRTSLDALVSALDGMPDEHQLRIGTQFVAHVGELRRLAADLRRDDRCSDCGRRSTSGGPAVAGTADTSRAAALRVDVGGQHARCLSAIGLGPPVVADTVAERVGLTPNQTATRLMELRERGGFVEYVYDGDGKRRTGTTRSGNAAYLQRLTARGIEHLAWLERQDPK